VASSLSPRQLAAPLDSAQAAGLVSGLYGAIRELSRTFIEVPDSAVDDKIEEAIARVAEVIGVDWAAVTHLTKAQLVEAFREGYLPGRGTTLHVGGKDLGVFEGKGFADAIFSIWLGATPPSEDLKKGMLG
jgi:hypothetical protein